jgi:unsaturated chondroitin disaccharide hydrolase
MYGVTGDSSWRAAAERWTLPQSVNQFNTTTHDVGFMLMTSYGLGHQMTGSSAYREALLNGAQSLASRFDPDVRSIRSWDWGEWSYPVIIDNLMNLELLFYATRVGGDARLHEIAHAHALTTLRDHVRADGSTFHLVDYDPLTGAVRSRGTYAGASDASTWSRGQAWAVYGFTMVYRYTNDPRLLDAAERTADYFIDHLPADSVPYWDFNAPGIPNTSRDSSAAAIAASALLELSSFSSDARAKRYESAAGALLERLSSDAYLAIAGGSPGILLHGVGAFPFNVEVDVSLIYGDYYFMQALFRRATGRLHDF